MGVKAYSMNIIEVIKSEKLSEQARLDKVKDIFNSRKHFNKQDIYKTGIYKTDCMGRNALSLAILLCRGHAIVKFLIENGGSRLLNNKDLFKKTPLEIACENKCENVIKTLLASGVDLQRQSAIFGNKFFIEVLMGYIKEENERCRLAEVKNAFKLTKKDSRNTQAY